MSVAPSEPSTPPTGDDKGFTLVEVLVGLAMMMVVMTAVAAGIVTAAMAERDSVAINRARALAEKVLAQTDTLPTSQLGHYDNDGVPNAITGLPESVCSRQYSSSTCLAEERTVRLAGDRPANALMPPATQTFTIDGDAAAQAKKLVKRVYAVETYVLDPAVGVWHGAQFLTEEDNRRIVIVVRWTSNGKQKHYALSRYRAASRDRCASRAAPNILGNPSGGQLGSVCVGIVASPTNTTWPAGTSAGTQVPVRVSGSALVTDAPVTIYFRQPTSHGTNATGFVNHRVVSVKATLWNGSTTVNLTDPGGTGFWQYAIPSGTAYVPDAPVSITPTYATGKTAGAQRVYSRALLPPNVTDPAITVNTIRIDVSNTNPISGTATTRLCTKNDGTLWFNQRLYINVANNDPQDGNGNLTGHYTYKFAPSANWSTDVQKRVSGVPEISYWAHTPTSTLTAKTPFHWTYLQMWHYTSASAGAPLGMRYVSTTGSTTIGALNTTTYGFLFPTKAYASASATALKSSYSGAVQYPTFFRKSVVVDVQLIRPYDGKRASLKVKIPVYRSNTGTSTDCRTGTAAQPTY